MREEYVRHKKYPQALNRAISSSKVEYSADSVALLLADVATSLANVATPFLVVLAIPLISVGHFLQSTKKWERTYGPIWPPLGLHLFYAKSGGSNHF